jgi:hypothetical protein
VQEQTLTSPGHSLLAKFGPALAGVIFLLAFYGRGLGDYFYQDDFGWLHIGPAKDFGHFLWLLFAPHAHGNIRPWSENLFFYGLKTLFGVNPLPFRIVVFVTAAADVVLLAALVRRLTGSALAAGCAPVLWLANPNVAPSLVWTSIYNQSQYVFFVLLALLLFLQGKYWQQTIVFVLGLGSLEVVVMYPVIALAYALLFDRSKIRRAIPLFAISAAYTILHFWAAGSQSGPYAIQINSRIFTTLGAYVKLALGPQTLAQFNFDWPAWYAIAASALIGAGLIAAISVDWRVGVFGLAWFVALLVPMLPLPEHVEDYALTGPVIGIAVILAGAIARRPIAIAVTTALYLAVCLPAAWQVTSWNVERGEVARDVVSSIVERASAHPGKLLLVTGLNTDQFYSGFADHPFDLLGFQHIYIAPGGARNVNDSRGWVPQFELPQDTVNSLLAERKAVMVDVSGGRARDVPPQ